MTRGRNVRILLASGGAMTFWAVAILVAIDDVDFFNPQDFFDFGLHHEHIFLALVVLGIVAGALALA